MDDIKDKEIVSILYRDFPQVYLQIVEYIERLK